MKKTFYLLLTGLIFQSCYSPKSEIEIDKHPEIPEFPYFSDKNIRAVKVLELPLSQEKNCLYLQKGDYFFVQNYPHLDSFENNICRIFILKDDQIILFEKWKDNPQKNNLAFLDENSNLFVNDRKYFAPHYDKKKMLPLYDLDQIFKNYEPLYKVGEDEKQTRLLQKIDDEKRVLQKNTLEKINKMLISTEERELAAQAEQGYNYLCNPDEKNPFLVSSNIFRKIKNFNQYDDQKSSDDKDSLFVQFHSKIEKTSK